MIGCKPTDEDMCLDAARKFEVAQGDVDNVLVQIGAALAGNLGRHFVEQRQHDRDVVRCKAPENVFLGPNFPDVQTVGIQVIDLTEGSVLNQLLQLQDCRMVAEDVPDHQDPTILLRDPHEIFAMFDVDRQRLFDEDIFASLQSGFGHFIVSHRRRGQGDRIDGWVGQQPGMSWIGT